MFCGSIPTELYNKFQLKVASLIQSRQEAKKGKHDKGAGFAHTPGFMIAVVKDAVRSVKAAGPEETASPEVQQMKSMTPPKGGFTDVGRHTGSMPRDTSWHLAKETLLVSCQPADHGNICTAPSLQISAAAWCCQRHCLWSFPMWHSKPTPM